MKLLMTTILSFAFCQAFSQSLTGTWQQTRQTNCLENMVSDSVKTDDNMLKDFSSKSSYSPRVMNFRDDNSGEEMIKTMEKKKASSTKKFLYKHDGESLYILDKKSRLITSQLVIETLTSDSLVYYVAGKQCEKNFFVRVK